ncbi:MAG: hypothetical protein WAU70_17160 [Flavobacteriales bacterium]
MPAAPKELLSLLLAVDIVDPFWMRNSIPRELARNFVIAYLPGLAGWVARKRMG